MGRLGEPLDALERAIMGPEVIEEEHKKVIYIAGPVTGVERYWEPFEAAQDEIEAMGFIALTPTRQPKGMSNEQYMRICMAMIDSADVAAFLPDFRDSYGARIEFYYCEYIEKEIRYLKDGDY